MGIFSRPVPPKPLLKENKDYEFTGIEIANEAINAVKLLSGPYANVVYYYGGVKIIPENGMNRLAYQYTIWDPASHAPDELKTKEFMHYLGDVLVSIIADESNSGELCGPSPEDEE